MAAVRLLRSAAGWRPRPVHSRSFRQPQRSHRLTPSDDELLQKTTIHHLERDSPNILFIESYSSHGFTINGNMVGTHKDIVPESLALFHMLEPKIEIVVLGTGARVERLDPAVLKCLQQRGIAVEVQNTPNACATFNFLVSERRVTAAGLIPPPAFVPE